MRDYRDHLEDEVQRRTRELREQADSQQDALAALRNSEEALRLLIEDVEDYAIFRLDPDGRVASWNAGAEKIKQYRADEIIGQHFSRFYLPQDVQDGKPERELKTAAAEGRVEDEGLRVRRDGSQFFANVVITALRDETGELRGFSKVTRDITKRKQAEDVLSAINWVFREALACDTVEQVANACLEKAQELTRSQFGFIAEVNERGRFDTFAISDTGWSACRIPGSRELLMANDLEIRGVRGRVVKDGRTLILNSPAGHPDWIEPPEGHPRLTAFLGVPLKRGNDVVGIIGLANKEAGYDAADQQVVEELSAAYLQALMYKRAQNELERHREQLEETVQARTAELEATAAQLTEANKELEGFSYSVSHDLRAPLRHLSGFADLLIKHADASLDEKARRYVGIIQEAAHQMGCLIDDLLTFSRTSRAEMKLSRFPLGDLVQQVVGELAPEAKGREIHWEIGDLPEVLADRSLLRLVLVNLLTNAVKYTRPRPQARIEIGVAPSDEAETVIFVRDNGVGFDMRYVDKLFGVFQRLHRADEFEGTGIGLANVQRIVHRHGGKAWAEGEVDRGATFYFTLPEGTGD